MIENFISIGKLAKATGMPAETIRYYEKIGLLTAPVRTESNYRLYRAEDVNRLSFVRRARDIGFSIDQVRSLVALADHREEDCAMVDHLALENLTTIERKIADLTILKEQLTGLLSSCQGGTVADCRIIDALTPGAVSTCQLHGAVQLAKEPDKMPLLDPTR